MLPALVFNQKNSARFQLVVIEKRKNFFSGLDIEGFQGHAAYCLRQSWWSGGRSACQLWIPAVSQGLFGGKHLVQSLKSEDRSHVIKITLMTTFAGQNCSFCLTTACASADNRCRSQ